MAKVLPKVSEELVNFLSVARFRNSQRGCGIDVFVLISAHVVYGNVSGIRTEIGPEGPAPHPSEGEWCILILTACVDAVGVQDGYNARRCLWSNMHSR